MKSLSKLTRRFCIISTLIAVMGTINSACSQDNEFGDIDIQKEIGTLAQRNITRSGESSAILTKKVGSFDIQPSFKFLYYDNSIEKDRDTTININLHIDIYKSYPSNNSLNESYVAIITIPEDQEVPFGFDLEEHGRIQITAINHVLVTVVAYFKGAVDEYSKEFIVSK